MTRRTVAPDIHRPDLGKPHGFAGEFTGQTFTFRATPGCSHIRQEPALCQTILTVTGSVSPGLRIVGVNVNGAPRAFGHIDETTVCVWPLIPLECDRVMVVCEGPSKAPAVRDFDPSKALMAPRSYYPSLNDSYGLQAPCRQASSTQTPKQTRTP